MLGHSKGSRVGTGFMGSQETEFNLGSNFWVPSNVQRGHVGLVSVPIKDQQEWDEERGGLSCIRSGGSIPVEGPVVVVVGCDYPGDLRNGPTEKDDMTWTTIFDGRSENL